MRLGWYRRNCVELPSTTIYFSHAMRRWIGLPGSACHPIWRVSPNAFLVPGTEPQLVVIRKLDPEARTYLARHADARVHYLIDDDIWSGIGDPALPECYRERLLELARESTEPLLERADHVYVTSEGLQGRITRLSLLVQPCMTEPAASLDHHEHGSLGIVFAGTRSHCQDLASIATPLAQFLREHPDCRLETFLGRYAPRELWLPNVRHHAPLAWPDYRQVLRTRRFHIGLAPARPTPFNTSRSCSKILDFASFGAAPVYGEGVAFRHLAARSGAAFTADDFSGDWLALLETIYCNRRGLRGTAAANRDLALRLSSPQALQSFWLHELGLGMQAGDKRSAA